MPDLDSDTRTVRAVTSRLVSWGVGGGLVTAALLLAVSYLAPALFTPEFLAAVRNPSGGDPAVNKAFIEQIQAAGQPGGTGLGATALSDSSFINQLDPRLARPFLVGFSDAMSMVFVAAAGVLVLAFIASLFLPHVDLGPKPGAQRDEDAPAAAAVGH